MISEPPHFVHSPSCYLAGEQPTIADYLLLPMLDYLEKVPPGKQLMSEAPAAEKWLQRMRQRPACEKILAS